jgi:voltage-dependent potassium channel beta subunit
LGDSGLKVSEVSLGGWLTQGRTLSDDQTTNLVRRAFDKGVICFDTADIYNKGEAELSLGIAIEGMRRQDLVIATKCFWPMTENPNDRGLSRKHVMESVHGSLKRMKIDYIDLYQCHRHDPETPMHELVRTMDDLVRQGKILYWGVSEWPAEEIEKAVAMAKELNCVAPISNQPNYSLLVRRIEDDVLPTSKKLGMGQIVFSPLAQGVLTGKYKPGQQPEQGSRAADPKSNTFMQDKMSDEILARVEKLSAFAAELGVTTGQLALVWCLRDPGIDSVIVGATKESQLDENIAASGLNFSADVWERCEKIVDGAGD